MNYKNILYRLRDWRDQTANKYGNLMRKIKTSQDIKLVASLLVLIGLILSPTLFAKAPSSTTVAQADSQSPLPSTPASAPEGSKEPVQSPQAPTATKTEEPKKPIAAQNQKAPAKSSSAPSRPASTRETISNRNSTNTSASTPTNTPQPSGILGYINQTRAEKGLSQLAYNSALNSASKAKSEDMLAKNYFAHTNPDGKTDFDFIRESGYTFSFAGSNIAKGNFTEKTVFDAWMNSEGHRANILDPRAREFGYGVAGTYFTMMVGAR